MLFYRFLFAFVKHKISRRPLARLNVMRRVPSTGTLPPQVALQPVLLFLAFKQALQQFLNTAAACRLKLLFEPCFQFSIADLDHHYSPLLGRNSLNCPDGDLNTRGSAPG
jgi:hypothetical protein